MERDKLFMRRALELAELGRGSVSPNPMVGCIIVHNNQIIGEGYHKVYGGPHAEPNAISSVKNLELLKESTVYVTLEPCAHWGKTPPCAELLIKHQVKKVVIGAVDTNPLVGGKGIAMLKAAGVEVVSGVLERSVRDQNRRFFINMEHKRPYILLKWAETADGFVARRNYDSKWISNTYSRQLVHQWRAEEGGIVVGKNTLIYDNPSLNVRDSVGKNPVRIVIASSIDTQSAYHVLDGKIPTLIFNQEIERQAANLEFIKMADTRDLPKILEVLYQRKIGSLLVEGGSQLLQSFVSANLWDEARIFRSLQSFGDGFAAPILSGTIIQELDVMGDKLSVYYNN